MVDQIGLGQEASPDGQILCGRTQLAGCDQDGDRRPSVPDDRDQPKPVHRPRHLYVRENDRYLVDRLEHRNRMIGIDSLNGLKTEVSNHVSSIRSDEKFILHNQNY
jgi:hypothetical protein